MQPHLALVPHCTVPPRRAMSGSDVPSLPNEGLNIIMCTMMNKYMARWQLKISMESVTLSKNVVGKINSSGTTMIQTNRRRKGKSSSNEQQFQTNCRAHEEPWFQFRHKMAIIKDIDKTRSRWCLSLDPEVQNNSKTFSVLQRFFCQLRCKKLSTGVLWCQCVSSVEPGEHIIASSDGSWQFNKQPEEIPLCYRPVARSLMPGQGWSSC